MSASEFQRLRELFEEALELSSGERGSLVARVVQEDPDLARELQGMLDAHDEPSSALDPEQGPGARLDVDPNESFGLEGRTIGAYRVLRHIASGGMGAVYEAEQEEPRRRVALKVMHTVLRGEQTRRRFRREAAILGSLHHPGIAQIFEAGTFRDGALELPFMVMEYLEGEQLIEYARARSLSIRDRLPLFVRVCEAVEHAHQRGVVHRDLKPDNVLVDASGAPKIFDFGVAALSRGDQDPSTLMTTPGMVLGTLAYMSPEQARGDAGEVDARADVHGLGVILFELLTGRLPYDLRGCATPEAIRILTEEEPSSAATVSPELRGDLDTILRRALEKNPVRRFPSAAELAADLERHLHSRPIHSRPPTRGYRLRRWMQRNRGAVLAMAMVITSLLAATIVSSLAAIDSGEKTRVANEALDDARLRLEELHEMLSIWRAESFGQPFPQRPRLTRLQLDLVEEAHPGFERRWNEIITENDLVESGEVARAREQGEALIALGDDVEGATRDCIAGLLTTCAEELLLANAPGSGRILAHAEGLVGEIHAPTDPRLQVIRALWIDSLNREARHAEAARLARGWLGELEAREARSDREALALYRSRLAAALVGLVDHEAAGHLLEDSLEVVRSTWPGTMLAFEARAARIGVYEGMGEEERAVAEREELARELEGPRFFSQYHARIAMGPRYAELWEALQELEHAAEESGDRAQEALDAFRSTRSRLGVREGSALASLCARSLVLSGNWSGNVWRYYHRTTRTIYGEALHLLQDSPDRAPDTLARALWGSAKGYLDTTEPVQAEALLRRALGVVTEGEDFFTVSVEAHLGSSLAKSGQHEEAHRLLVRGFRRLIEWAGPTNDNVYHTLESLFTLHRSWGHTEATVPHEEELEALLSGSDLASWYLVLSYKAAIVFDRDRALGLIERARALAPLRRRAWMDVGRVHARLGNLEAALAALERAKDPQPETLMAGKWPPFAFHLDLGLILERHGQLERACAAYEQALQDDEFDARPLVGLTRIRLRAGDVEAAIAHARRTLDLDEAIGARALGPALLAAGRVDEALPFFERGARFRGRPDGTGWWSGYGAALVAAGRSDDARALLEALTVEWPDDPYAWSERARFLTTCPSLESGDRTRGLECAKRAVDASNRQGAAVLAVLAKAQLLAGDRSAALSSLEEAEALLRQGTAEWITRNDIQQLREESFESRAER